MSKIRDFQASNLGPGRLTVSLGFSLTQNLTRSRSLNKGDGEAFSPTSSLPGVVNVGKPAFRVG